MGTNAPQPTVPDTGTSHRYDDPAAGAPAGATTDEGVTVTAQGNGSESFGRVDADGTVRYAAVTGRFHLDRTAHGSVAQDDGVYSLLWEKTAGGWKIILDHSS